MVTPPWVAADGAGGAAAAAVAVEVVGASPGLVCGCLASLLLSAIFLTKGSRDNWGDVTTKFNTPAPSPSQLLSRHFLL